MTVTVTRRSEPPNREWIKISIGAMYGVVDHEMTPLAAEALVRELQQKINEARGAMNKVKAFWK